MRKRPKLELHCINNTAAANSVLVSTLYTCLHSLRYFCYYSLFVLVFQALDVRFIEYMPFDGNRWNLSKFIPYRDMLSKVVAQWPQLTRLTDQPNDTSKV